jgi:hypothetical protein
MTSGLITIDDQILTTLTSPWPLHPGSRQADPGHEQIGGFPPRRAESNLRVGAATLFESGLPDRQIVILHTGPQSSSFILHMT